MTATPAGTRTVTTFAAAFAAALEDLGVRRAFGISGGAISFFWSALGGTGIEVTHFRHESGAAFAACEASIESGAPVVIFVTTGPGLTNVLTGIYAARHEAAQVVLVSASTERAMYGRRPIQETGPRTLPQDGIFTAGPLFDYAAVVTSTGQFPALIDALTDGLTRRPGFVAHISLTLSVQREEIDRVVRPSLSTTRRVRDRGDPAEHAAAEAYTLLRDQPWVLWIGGGTRQLSGPVRRLAHAAGVPVMATPRGKGVIAEDDPAYLGVTGFAGHQSVLTYLEHHRPAYTLVLGTAMGDFASGYNPSYAPASAFIHVDVDPSAHGQAYPAVKTIPVLCEAGAFCDRLSELFAAEPEPRPRPSLRVAPFDHDGLPTGGGLIDPSHVMAVVQSVFVDNGVLVMAETGNALAWAINQLRFADPLGWRAPSGLVGSMGHFSSGVVGAALVSSRKAAALVGDGSMLMLNEVSTAVHTDAAAIWVVLNDSRYNMCAQGAVVLGLTNVDCSMPVTDFAALGRALGATGITVQHPDELTASLTEALHATGPVVVDVRIDPERGAPTKGRNAGLLRDSATKETSA
jgi:acetolactate synthase-1/2/3 large subunit